MAQRTATGPAGPTSQEDTLKSEAKATARSAGDIIRSGRDQALGDAKVMVRDAADQQRRRAAESLSGMAQALHNSARDLQKESSTMSHYTDMAAERLDEVAKYLRQADWQDMRQSAESFARRQPYWFIGGAVAAGFLAARFIKSSGVTARDVVGSGQSRHQGGSDMDYTAGSTGRGGSAYAPAASSYPPAAPGVGELP